MQKLKTQKGITLIALIITIIVMLILVGVSVTVALNGGLFGTANQAKSDTQKAITAEQKLADGKIKVGDNWYASYQDYLDGIEYMPGIIIDKESMTLIISSGYNSETNPVTEEITASLNQIEGEITWTNSDETIAKIAVVGNKVTITAEAEGTATITASCEYEGETYTETCEIEVMELTGWDLGKVDPIKNGEYIVPIPKGFEVSTKETEDEVSEGLVVRDGANEFVWIPVSNAASYAEDGFGPLTATHSTTTYVYDSQEELNYYYGMQEDGTTPYYNYADFTYAADKTNVETSIQTYGGFYVGRYETTIDGSTIGVQAGKTILTAATLLKTGTNTTSNDEYHYRWWGLYKAQKDMYKNNSSVGSLMISSKQWDAIMTFTGYGSTKRATDTYTTKPDLSGSAYSTDNTQYDVSKNIYDLAGNVREYTLRAGSRNTRADRGGYYSVGSVSSASYSINFDPTNSYTNVRF